ncbi:hypothetical protein [Cellulomonas sp.]|uniref:hypothetical protein n=1 Tax=Cellulomonas sp. TaxID=40001 RepID=UPI002D5EF97D|nr:hypothetical protein [Cellulomonas sp.]HYQ74585.1 hypothetical protein [Cellulomonas sp.]
MSMYPAWSFRIPLRTDVDPATLRVLEAVARDTPPEPADLATLPPGVAHYLGDWTRMLTAERPPYVGPPVRLSRHWGGGVVAMIEFSQHDDEFADGGYDLWAWVLQLVARPAQDRVLIGHGAADHDDLDWRPVVADAVGVTEGDDPVTPWQELDAYWAERPRR